MYANLYKINMYVNREDEWAALQKVFALLQQYEGLTPDNTVILNVSPDYSSTVAMHMAHFMSANGEMMNLIPVDVAYPDEDSSPYREAFTQLIPTLKDYHNIILVEAGVITGKNYAFMVKELEDAGYNPITVALYENKHSIHKCNVVGEYYDAELKELEFYYEEYNRHWDTQGKFMLVRERDQKTLRATKIKWVEWNENGSAKEMHDEPAVGCSLILDPQHLYAYTWLTTEVAEILEKTPATVKFKTKNSTYILTNLERENII